MKQKRKPKDFSKKRRRDKLVKRSTKNGGAQFSRALSSPEHDFLRRSITFLTDVHSARPRVSKKARAVLDQLESHVLGQLAAWQAMPATTKILSGASWVGKFPDSKATSVLTTPFATAVDKFIAAMKAGGASVAIGTTYRPVERAYLMYYAWKISRKEIVAADVPDMAGVDVEWVHNSDAKSIQAAKDMVAGYAIVAAPSLTSRHTEKRAIDMTISWSGTLTIKKANGTSTSIATTPRTGENADLVTIGSGYGVIKATFAGDPPHWSDDGH